MKNKQLLTATTAPLNELVRIVGAVAMHASKDHTRLALTVIKIDADGMTATDSYTAATFTPITPISTGQAMMIDAKELVTAITAGIKTFKRDAAVAVIDTVGSQWRLTITGKTATTTATGDLINIEYPKVKVVMDGARSSGDYIYSPTGVNPSYLANLCDASVKFSGKDGSPMVLKNWQDPTKPMLFETSCDLGTLTQILMPQRLK
jgi:hypothetical protein